MESSFWDERYAQEAYVYGKQPNAFLAAALEDMPVGKLLLPCEGEGRNAVYAASLGWEVTAFDYSESGKAKCLAWSQEKGVTVDYTIADAAVFDYGKAKYDAVALIFAHFPEGLRQHVHRQVVAALKPGGKLILEAFNPLQLNNFSGGPKSKDLLYTVNILAADFGDLSVTLLEEATTVLDEGAYHQGKADVVRLMATK